MSIAAEYLQSAALSVSGRKRATNEDAVYHHTDRTIYGGAAGLYIVCDGLGGYEGGGVASWLAVETVMTELLPALLGALPRSSAPGISAPEAWERSILAAVSEANAAIRQRCQGMPEEGKKMGTTIALALIAGKTAHVAHVGDSRVYVWRRERLTQITQDHSLVAELAEEGQISHSEIADHPRSNILLRALGQKDSVEVDLQEWTLHPGDRLLLSSDGLWKAFPEPAELASWLGSAAPPAEICGRLVHEADRRDGSDNISAVVVAWAEPAEQQKKKSRQASMPSMASTETEPLPA